MIQKIHREIMQELITYEMEILFSHDEEIMPARRIADAMQRIAHVAFHEGQTYALSSLLTITDVARHFGLSERRIRAIAQHRHERFGIGVHLNGTTWLFRPEELVHLQPGKPGRPRKQNSI